MRIIVLIFFLIITACAKSIFAQSAAEKLAPETREAISNHLMAIQNLYLQNQTTVPNIAFANTLSDKEIKILLHNSSTDFPVILEDVVVDIVQLLIGNYSESCRYLLGISTEKDAEMSKIFSSEDIPTNLRYLILLNSIHTQSSTQNKSGIWELPYAVGRLYHLQINEYLDERKDIIKFSNVTAGLLKDFYAMYQSWPLAVSALSCGPIEINNAIKNSAAGNSFDKIYTFLPSPQRDLYPMFLATQLIFTHPEQFGISPGLSNNKTPVDTIIIREKLHLEQAENVLKIESNLLAGLNPIYTHRIIPADENKPLPLILPKSHSKLFFELQDSIFSFKDSVFFDIKPEIKTPEITAPIFPGKGYKPINYTIKSGDNLGYIASLFHVSISDIRYWNDINGNLIRAGETLIIYLPENKANNLSQTQSINTNQENKSEQLKAGEYQIYTVKSGDNPWTIAQQFPGVSDQDIIRWNGINPRTLHVGQELKIKILKTE
jgi:membrane-bound lytic murein transglycosylase D